MGALTTLRILLSLLLPALLLLAAVAEPPASERAALLAFIDAVPHAPRVAWPPAAGNSSSVCSWVGVFCDAAASSVIALRLPGAGLSGALPAGPLQQLPSLRALSLHSNALSGPLPGDLLAALPNLRAIYLQSNRLSGEIPPQLGRLNHLARLDLSSNNFSGSLPGLPVIASLTSFNVSYNRLNGSIPPSVSRFPASSFAGNLGLCGAPLQPCSPFFPPSPAPSEAAGNNIGSGGTDHHHGLSAGAIAGIVIGSVAALLILILLIFFLARRRRADASAEPKPAPASRGIAPPAGIPAIPASRKDPGAPAAPASGPSGTSAGGDRSRLVFVGSGPPGYSFDLEDLLRASAEVLGKGTLGTSYKAVLEDGTTVVVKRLKDVMAAPSEFAAVMTGLGGVRHQNLLPLRAYYYSKDEKLLVFDFLPSGSLSSLLHGGRGSGRTPLDWEARLRCAVSAARGLVHLHAAQHLVHGNIKSSNLLLRPDFDAAALSDYALLSLFSPSPSRAGGGGGYRAPEVIDTRRPSFKSDVYSLGVLLLELLTGKSPSHASFDGDNAIDLPRWVQSVVREEWTAEVFDADLVRLGDGSEEEMVALLQVALACIATVPDARPNAVDALRMIEDISGSGSAARVDSATEESTGGALTASEEEHTKGGALARTK